MPVDGLLAAIAVDVVVDLIRNTGDRTVLALNLNGIVIWAGDDRWYDGLETTIISRDCVCDQGTGLVSEKGVQGRRPCQIFEVHLGPVSIHKSYITVLLDITHCEDFRPDKGRH